MGIHGFRAGLEHWASWSLEPLWLFNLSKGMPVCFLVLLVAWGTIVEIAASVALEPLSSDWKDKAPITSVGTFLFVSPFAHVFEEPLEWPSIGMRTTMIHLVSELLCFCWSQISLRELVLEEGSPDFREHFECLWVIGDDRFKFLFIGFRQTIS